MKQNWTITHFYFTYFIEDARIKNETQHVESMSKIVSLERHQKPSEQEELKIKVIVLVGLEFMFYYQKCDY